MVSIINNLNEDLENINQWSKKWHTNFNSQKTVSLLVSNKPKFEGRFPLLLLDGVPAKHLKTHKHLGIILNS